MAFSHNVDRTSSVTPPTSFTELCPFVNFSDRPSVNPTVQVRNSKTIRDTLTIWYKYKTSSVIVDRIRIRSPSIFFTELCPFANFSIQIASAQQL